MPAFETQPLTVIGVAAGLFVPMTGPLSSADYGDVRFRVWADGILPTDASPTVVPAAQFSDDGETWTDTAVAFNYTAATPPQSVWDCTSFLAWKNLYNTTDLNNPTRRLYVRFGVRLTSPSGPNYAGRIVLAVENKPVFARTLLSDQRIVNCLLSTGTPGDTFTPLTEFIEAAEFTHARFTFELVTSTGEIEILPAFQTADTEFVSSTSPTWRATSLTPRSTAGVTYGTTFSELFPTGLEADAKRRLIRFGVSARNTATSGAVAETAAVRLRVDLRDRGTP